MRPIILGWLLHVTCWTRALLDEKGRLILRPLREGLLVEGKTASTATRFANETRTFFENRGSIL